MFDLQPPRHIPTLPWPCKNAKTLNRDRRSYSSKTVLVTQRASGFNLEIELKNIIPRCVSIFEFLHSQGQKQTLQRVRARSVHTRIVLQNPKNAERLISRQNRKRAPIANR